MLEIAQGFVGAYMNFVGDVFLSIGSIAVVCAVVLGVVRLYSQKAIARGLALGICGVFFVGRFVHFGQIDAFTLQDIGVDLILGGVLIAAALFVPRKMLQTKEHVLVKNFWKDVLIILALALSIAVQMQHIGRNAIDGDEIFQFEAAAGYIHTGRMVQWDFKADKPFIGSDGEEWLYTRASGDTWVIAQSMRVFGISAWAARLPSVVSFILLVVGVYIVMRAWLRNRTTAAVIAFTFAFSSTFIQMGSFVRMYAPFYLFFAATVVCVYQSFAAYVQNKWKESALWAAVCVPLYIITVHLHLVGLILIPCFLAFVVVEWITQLALHRKFFAKQVAPMTYAMIAAVIVAAGILIADSVYHFIIWRVISFEFRNPVYELYAFFDFPIYGFTAAIFVIGLCTMFRKSLAMRFLGVISSSLFLAFLGVLKSAPARRYFAFVSILIIPFAVVSARDVLKSLGVPLRFRKLPALAIALTVLCVPVSFPGVPSVSIFNQSVEDSTIPVDYATAYGYIQGHMAPNDVVFAVSFRNFYWGKDDHTTVLDLHRNDKRSLSSVARMEYLMFRYKKGWIVWPKELSRATKEVHAYVKSISHHIGGLEDTNMDVFYFDVTNKTPIYQNVQKDLRKKADDAMVAAGFVSSFDVPLLIRESGQSKLFVFSEGEKHWITSSKVFSDCEYIHSDTQEVSSALFAQVPTGDPIGSGADCIAF